MFPPGYHLTLLRGDDGTPFHDPAEQERLWGRRWGAVDEVGRLRMVLVRRPLGEFGAVRADCWDEDARSLAGAAKMTDHVETFAFWAPEIDDRDVSRPVLERRGGLARPGHLEDAHARARCPPAKPDAPVIRTRKDLGGSGRAGA